MRNIITSIVVSLISMLSFSQNKTSEKEYNRWSVELNAGQNKAAAPFAPEYYSSNPNKYFNFSGVNHFDIGARYMLSNYFGFKFDAGYDQIKNLSGSGSLPFETNQYRFALQGLVNMARVLKFEDFTSRYGLLFHSGLQVSRLAPQMGVNNGLFEDNGGFIVGITPQIKITKRLVLTVDFSYIANVRQHFNWDGSYSVAANNLSGTLYNSSVGFTFYLGKKEVHADWYLNKPAMALATPTKYDDAELLKRIDDLERKSVDSDKDGVPDSRDIEINTIAGFKVDSQGKAWDRNKNGIPDEQEKEVATAVAEPEKVSNKDPEYMAIIEFEYNTMYYDFNRIDPNKQSRQKMAFLVAYLKKHPDINIRLDGYTDSVGSIQSNNKLSQKRVENLKNILTSYGISADRIELKSNGIDSIYTNTVAAQPMARRVEITIK